MSNSDNSEKAVDRPIPPAPEPSVPVPAPASKSDDSEPVSRERAGMVLEDMHSLLAVVQKELIAEIDRKRAPLIEKDVAKVIKMLRDKPELLPEKVQKVVRVDIIQRSGRDPFSRILVKRFSRLLEDPNNRTLAQGALPRRMIPGFLAVVRLLTGGPNYDRMQERARELVSKRQTVPEDLADPSFWTNLYNTDEGQAIAISVFITMASRFARYQRRKEWFLKVINNALDVAKKPKSISDDAWNWRMNDSHFVEMFTRVFIQDMKTMSLRHDFRAILDAEFDDTAKTQVEEMLTHLREDIKRVLSQSRQVTSD